MINLDYSDSEEKPDQEFIDKFANERKMFGVSERDTWGFENHMFGVLHNGITMLADNAHGWPQSKEYPEYEDWVTALRTIAFKLKWLYKEGEYHANLFSRYANSPDAIDDDWLDWVNADKSADPAYQRYKMFDALHQAKKEAYFNEVMDWLKNWWYALWD